MARRVKLKEVKRVDLEISAWLLEWTMNPDWDLEAFGAYWLICLMLYNNGGKIEFDLEKLSIFCRSDPIQFANVWRRIESKLTLSGNYVFQKRVLKELKASRKRMQSAVTAGLIGAQKRWQSHSDPNTKRRTKRIEDETKTNTTYEGARAHALSDSLRFVEHLEKTLKPRTKSDRKAILNLTRWLMITIKAGRDVGVYEKVLEIARGSKGRNPMAVFFSRLDEEIGYRARAAKDKGGD